MLKGERGRRLRGLQQAFHREAMRRPYFPLFINQRRACWLARFDPLSRPCEGRFEAAHFIGRQSIRNCPTLLGIDEEIVELAQWDARNGLPACEHHHRRFDNHADAGPGSGLLVPKDDLDFELLEFIEDWGLQSEAERRFLPS